VHFSARSLRGQPPKRDNVPLSPQQRARLTSKLTDFVLHRQGSLGRDPFRSYSNRVPLDGINPENVAKSQRWKSRLRHWLALFETLALSALCMKLILQLAPQLQSSQIANRLARSLDSPSLLIVLCAFSIGLPILFLLNVIPRYDQDILFARLLRKEAESKRPISDGLVADILRDPRFRDIFDRATALTFPPDQQTLTTRLLSALENDENFIQLFKERYEARERHQNQGGGQPPQVGIASESDPVDSYFVYTARKLLFDAIFKDPDFAYLYDDVVYRRNTVGRWFSQIRENVKELFGKSEEKPGHKAAETASLVSVIAVVVVAVVAIFAHPSGPGGPHADGQQAKGACVTVTTDFHELAEVLKKQNEQSEPTPRVNLDIHPPSIKVPDTKVEVLPITVKEPVPEIPSKIDVNMKSVTPATECKCTQQAAKGREDIYIALDGKGKEARVLPNNDPTCSYNAETDKAWPPVSVTLKAKAKDGKSDEQCKGGTITIERLPTYDSNLDAWLTTEENSTQRIGICKDPPFLCGKKKINQLTIHVRPIQHLADLSTCQSQESQPQGGACRWPYTPIP
jgi:hypothetical protein